MMHRTDFAARGSFASCYLYAFCRIGSQYEHIERNTTQPRTLVLNMQHEGTCDKKRKINVVDACITATVPVVLWMFLQIIGEYPYNYLVEIDPLEDSLIYGDLLEFETSKVTIQMNNHEPESLYTLYDDNVARPDKHAAWMEFFRNTATRKNAKKSEHIVLNRESVADIQKARWFVSFCSR